MHKNCIHVDIIGMKLETLDILTILPMCFCCAIFVVLKIQCLNKYLQSIYVILNFLRQTCDNMCMTIPMQAGSMEVSLEFRGSFSQYIIMEKAHSNC